MSVEIYLLRWFYSYQAFQKYGGYLEANFLKDNSPELHKIFTAIGQFHAKYPEKDISSTDELKLYFFTLFPPISEVGTRAVEGLLSKMEQLIPSPDVAQDFVREHQKRSEAAKLGLLAIKVAEGSTPFSELLQASSKLVELDQPIGQKNEFVEVGEEGQFPGGGLSWRLSCLNKSLGPVRRGDNGFLFARPEAGKTTLALSESTFMAGQADGPTIYFNNEQPGELMYYRAAQAYLGITADTFFKYKKRAIQRFRKELPGYHIYDSAYMQRRDVERICRTYNPRLLVFDQLPKVKGFADDRHDLEMGAVFQWARELAKEYGPVVGLCQAGGTAEGKKYLTMDDVANSKTSMQAEADWILGVGKSHQEGMESIRHFSISKNKLLGDEGSDASLRHGKFDVRIKPEICRFEDL